jgi:hypothetical protein
MGAEAEAIGTFWRSRAPHIDWGHRLIAWFVDCDLGRVRIIVFGGVSIASVLLPRLCTNRIHTSPRT